MLLLIPLTFEKRLFLKRVDRVLTSSTSFLSWLMSILSLIHYTGPHDVRVLSSTFQCQQPSVIFPTARACDAYDGSLALFLVCPIHLCLLSGQLSIFKLLTHTCNLVSEFLVSKVYIGDWRHIFCLQLAFGLKLIPFRLEGI